MTSTTYPVAPALRKAARPRGASASRMPMVTGDRSHGHAGARGKRTVSRLGSYADATGRPREIVVCAGAGGSALVIDRDALTLGERCLVAHLAPDEPRENAGVVCDRYLADPSRGRCRRVSPADLEVLPCAAEECADDRAPTHPAWVPVLVDGHGRRYRIALVSRGDGMRELRWHEAARDHVPAGDAGEDGTTTPPHADGPVLSLRALVGRVESYEPACAITRRVVGRFRRDPKVSVCTLAAELHRVQSSPVVLNRGLREAVLRAIEREHLSLSEIAARCGRVKRGARGALCGETTWLARRVGLVPDAGKSSPTPWVRSDVLGLIARMGLGISPREVELG
jgi:hypothetical protein